MATLGTTLGSLEVGVIFSAVLLGICVLQVWNYYRHFRDDRWHLKFLVGWVFALDTVHTALIIHSAWYYTIDYYGQPASLATLVYTVPLSTIFSGVAAFSVQSFFVVRVWTVTRSPLLTGVCGLLSAGHFAFLTACVVEMYVLGDFVLFASHFLWGTCTVIAIAATADVVIGLTLCMALTRSRTGFSETSKILDKLVGFTMGTGLLIGLIEIVMLICFLTMDNLVWFAVYLVLAKMYPNSLLASLNIRTSLRNQSSHGYSGMGANDAARARLGARSVDRPVIELNTVASIAKDELTTKTAVADDDSDFRYHSTKDLGSPV